MNFRYLSRVEDFTKRLDEFKVDGLKATLQRLATNLLCHVVQIGHHLNSCYESMDHQDRHAA